MSQNSRQIDSSRRNALKTIGLGAVTATVGSGAVAAQSDSDENIDYTEVGDVSTFQSLAPSANVKLTADLDFSGLDIDPLGWGQDSSTREPYTGVFDGQGHTISNLTINKDGQVGLIAELADGAVFKNVKFDSVNITGTIGAGAVAGDMGKAVISEVDVLSGTVSGEEDIGGIVGQTAHNVSDGAEIKNCTNEASIDGNLQIGGIVGYTSIITYNCHNTGSVTGNSHVGGVAGEVYDTDIINCYNTANIDAGGPGGGLIGTLDGGDSNVRYSYSEANILGTGELGGLIGRATSEGDGIVEHSYAKGDVEIKTDALGSHVGGFIGRNEDNRIIKSCYSDGDVIGGNADYYGVGGFAGGNTGGLLDCYSLGDVNRSGAVPEAVGGIVGMNTAPEQSGGVTRCYVANCVVGGEDITINAIRGKGGNVTATYYEEGIGQNTSGLGAKLRSTSEMQGESVVDTMPEFEWGDVWYTSADSYPTLNIMSDIEESEKEIENGNLPTDGEDGDGGGLVAGGDLASWGILGAVVTGVAYFYHKGKDPRND